MNKKKYHSVFVILVYRNIDVLRDFYKHFSEDDAHTIVVNSFYDDKSLKDCESVALDHDADFIAVPNKGFGYGNNVGTKYAMDHYDFDFLVLSNSDIIIRDIHILKSFDSRPAIYAPRIRMLNNKDQNPNIPWFTSLFFYFQKRWTITGKRRDLKKAYVVSRGTRELFYLWVRLTRKKFYRIYSPHGAFIIFSKEAVNSLYPFFNEQMFLYNEENYLGMRAIKENIPVYYCPQIDILHLEGASSSNVSNKAFKESALVLFDWMKKNGF